MQGGVSRAGMNLLLKYVCYRPRLRLYHMTVDFSRTKHDPGLYEFENHYKIDRQHSTMAELLGTSHMIVTCGIESSNYYLIDADCRFMFSLYSMQIKRLVFSYHTFLWLTCINFLKSERCHNLCILNRLPSK